MDMEILLLNIVVLSLITNMILAIYGLLRKPSLIKKIIALSILNENVCLLAIYAGYRRNEPVPPVHKLPYSRDYTMFLVEHSVDPLPQALVITAIVIGLAFTMFLSIATIRLYQLSGTTNIHVLLKREIRVEEIEEEQEW